MNQGSAHHIFDDLPSGHSRQRHVPDMNMHPINFPNQDYKTDYSRLLSFKDFAGPYKDYKPPGNRSAVVGEKNWGDVPYLPSYLDPMYHKELAAGAPDNLYFRGPFYKGVSETHTEFVNRGVLPPRPYREFVRHYEEPGMKHEKSVTLTDYQPPLPMLPRDKAPCLREDTEKPSYQPEIKEPKNPHAKELEVRSQEPEVVYVDDEDYKRDFSTEHNDNFVCYQKDKSGTKIKDLQTVSSEIFLRNMREEHQSCKHPDVKSDFCDGSCKVKKTCPGLTPKRTSWLLHPKNYSFQNGVMLIPCKCRAADN